MISNIGKFLKSDNNPSAATFVKDINDLKKMRVKADYEEILIDYDIGKHSIALSEKSNNTLKKYI